MRKESLEDMINRTSYLLIEPKLPWNMICVNRGKENCKECQQIQCDSAGGGVPKPSEYKWKVVRINGVGKE